MKVEITRWKSNTKENKHRKGSIKKKEIRIDYHDTWDVAYTLAPIIAQMMKQLRETSHGYGAIKKEDVPVELHYTYGTAEEFTEGYSKEAWDWVLSEVEWAMNEIATDKENEPPFHTKVGEMNFLPIKDGSGSHTMEFVGWESTPESEAANKAYHDRIQNGCRLFGTYMMTMWD